MNFEKSQPISPEVISTDRPHEVVWNAQSQKGLGSTQWHFHEHLGQEICKGAIPTTNVRIVRHQSSRFWTNWDFSTSRKTVELAKQYIVFLLCYVMFNEWLSFSSLVLEILAATSETPNDCCFFLLQLIPGKPEKLKKMCLSAPSLITMRQYIVFGGGTYYVWFVYILYFLISN